MERSRIIAIAAAIIAGLCVLMAGKSCADDAIAQKKNRSTASQTDSQGEFHGIEIRTGSQTETAAQEFDLFGRPVESTAEHEDVEYDLFGRPITTAPPETETLPENTDENGEPIEDTSTEAVPDGETSAEDTSAEEPSAEDTSDSEENPTSASTAPPKISGFHHGDYDDEGNLKPTIPPDFAIIIR
ncbi:MAG: hypothetical protein J6U16_03025 [Ruminococcus sp.]|nr:hypothetical protein [Ruminococcus sp.]